MGSSFWQPIKNLTFGVYLGHIMVIDLLYYSMGPAHAPPPQRYPLSAYGCACDATGRAFDYDNFFGAYIFTANYTLACAGAAALWFLVCVPRSPELSLSLPFGSLTKLRS